MDTPERNQIGTPLSKFEDSPVFNYINSLSPIKPVKSIHITQTFNPLNFASLPSVFTSPHVNSHKESRFLKRNNCLDPSKPEFSSENGNKACTNEGIGVDAAQLYDNSAELQENFDSGVSNGEASAGPSSEHSKFAIELPRTLKYDCGSPDCDPTPRCGTEAGCMSASLVQYGQEASAKDSSEGEVHLSEMCRTDQTREGTECDWESLISDAADILIFNSPNDSEAFRGLIQKSMDPLTRFCTSLMSQLPQNDVNNVQNTQIVDPIDSGEQQETYDLSAKPGEDSELQEIDQTQDNPADIVLYKNMSSNTSEQMDNEVAMCMPHGSKAVSNLHRGMRRRCLDFEIVGARRKNLGDGSNSSSSMLSQSDEKIACHDKQLVPFKPGGDSSRCILPGIGLHLNALTTTSKDLKNVKHEDLSSGRQSYLPSSTASFHSPTNSQEPLHQSLTTASSERDTDLAENGVAHVEDASHASAYLVSDDFNQNSPKKKRRRLEHAGENESCKRCNCKKSKCLKLYCECFAAGVYCIEPCSCQDCFNKPIHEDTVLATRKQIESRNPLAFAPKVIRSADSVTEIGDESSTPASARHKRGCNCKKSNCLKKYCECYQGGVGCSIGCRCEGCKNAFGRKDGSAPLGTEAEQEEETEACENSTVEKALQKSEIQNNEEQNPSSALAITPLRLSRPLVPLPFSSNGKLPRTSFLTVGSSSGLYTSQKLGKPSILRSVPKFEKNFQTVPEDEMPEILRGNCSPSTGIKSSSPNSKRVTPPQSDFGASPSRRSGRKLILQSIPSFPSLTQH